MKVQVDEFGQANTEQVWCVSTDGGGPQSLQRATCPAMLSLVAMFLLARGSLFCTNASAVVTLPPRACIKKVSQRKRPSRRVPPISTKTYSGWLGRDGHVARSVSNHRALPQYWTEQLARFTSSTAGRRARVLDPPCRPTMPGIDLRSSMALPPMLGIFFNVRDHRDAQKIYQTSHPRGRSTSFANEPAGQARGQTAHQGSRK